MISVIQIDENMLSGVPCKICGEEPIFPFEPKFVKQNDEVLMECYIYSKCGCRIRYIQKVVKFSVDDCTMEELKNIEHIKPVIGEWNRLNA